MALKITKASDVIQVQNLVTCLYAEPGLGKTSMAFTADAPLLLDFDNGVHRSANRGDAVRVADWSAVADLQKADLTGYKTVIVDTAGRALDLLTVHIIDTDPKAGANGQLKIQGYGKLKSAFVGWLTRLRSYGMDVVLLTHATEEKKDEDLIVRLDVQGGSKNEIYKSADVMGRLSLKNGKRMLSFSPSDIAFGKNPGQLDPIEVPNFAAHPNFLGGVLATIKSKMNEQNEAQKHVKEALDAFKAKVDAGSTADDFNGFLKAVDSLDSRAQGNAKVILWAAAQEKKLDFDKVAGQFKAKAA
jgi:hypothetical protein